jgi:hypothetical protein
VSQAFGMELSFEPAELLSFVLRLLLNSSFAALVIYPVYYRLYKNREYVFTYFLFNLVTFALCLLLRKVPIELGFALGLFAVFGVLRYRTESIGIRDLTYLFVVIGLAMLNGVANKHVSFLELLAVNLAIVGATAALELPRSSRRERSLPLLYDNLPLLAPAQHAALLADLRARTGLGISRVEVKRVDLLKDAAELVVFYGAEGAD